MSETKRNTDLADKVGKDVARKLKARRHGRPKTWSGLGMMGLIGWSVVLPTLAGAGIGIWLDKHHPMDRSWALALLVAGLVLGCANAWYWVSNEDKAIQNEQQETDA
ncbi:MAG: AtpZ/AtpI family protein [Flavobacteriales bacterium]